jgi:class 3 adenylate cyclase
MPELPHGTVTFLFTDIEGSTELVKRLGDRYGDVLAAHRALLRDAFAAEGGQEMGTEGDALFYAFPRVRHAVRAAAAGQRALAEHAWPDGAYVRVRMGLHTGEPEVVESEYVGLGVHRVARVCAAAHGGQVLLSLSTAGVVADERIPGVAVEELGDYWLKDIDRPERLFQLLIDGVPNDFPPVRAPRAELVEEPADDAARPGRRRRLFVATAVAVALVGGGGGAAAVVLAGGGAANASNRPRAAKVTTQARHPKAQTRSADRLFVQTIDRLLADSQRTVALVKTFVPDVQGGRLAGDAAVARAHGFTAARNSFLVGLHEIGDTPPFYRSEQLLARSLDLSVQDDEVLERWTRHYAAGDDAAAAADLRRVVELGQQASAAKAAFLTEYGRARERVTGLDPSTLPSSY